MFAGESGGVLLAAGGTNFPDQKPWEGGSKVYYDTIFALDRPDGKWTRVGKLPRALGYGASIPTSEGLLCAGGATATEHRRECFLIRYRDRKLEIRPLPDLPAPRANLCGAGFGSLVFVAGGTETPMSTAAANTFWRLDLTALDKGWVALPPCPGPGRMLSVAAIADGAFYLFSGVSLAPGAEGKPVRTYLHDAWRYVPQKGWEPLPDLPFAAVAAPSPAPVIFGRIEIVGGDDGTLAAFEPKSQHPGFAKRLLEFDPRENAWTQSVEVPIAPVTCPVAKWQDRFVIVGGEIRPGVRTTEVWSLR